MTRAARRRSRAAAARLEILPTTTRWKPQRGDDPILVDFTGPGDLDLAGGMLEITGPVGVGTLTAMGPILQTSAAEPFTYRIEWTGPWTYTDPTDGQVKRLPPGNYSIVVKATPQGGSQQQSAPYDNVSLVEVSSLKLMPLTGDAAREANPNPGGGSRIFPEAAAPAPNDQVGDRDKVEVVATIFPSIPDPGPQPLLVYFRGLDVDDPSANAAPVDDEGFTYDNCLGGGCAVPPAGNVNGQNADTPVSVVVPSGQTEVTATFQVSGRQGDNYRVAASTSDTWLRGLSATQNSPSGEGILAPKSGETFATRVGKDVHKGVADARRVEGQFDLVNEPIRDKNGNPIQVPKRVDLRTGEPRTGSPVQEAVPDAVSFRRGLIIEDKPGELPSLGTIPRLGSGSERICTDPETSYRGHANRSGGNCHGDGAQGLRLRLPRFREGASADS